MGKNSAVSLIFFGLLVATVGMHNRKPAAPDPLSFAGLKHLSLVIAVHPECPSSRQTVAEAVRIYYRVPGEVRITALVFSEERESTHSLQVGVLDRLTQIKSQIVMDTNGALACQLGITNSAQALLFSPNGILRYNGGIIAPPQRFGNPGEDTVVDLISGASLNSVWSPAYGCSLDAAVCSHQHGLKTASNL